MKITQATNFRRTIGGLSLIAAPAFSVAYAALTISTEFSPDASTRLREIASNLNRESISLYVFLVSQILFIPAVLAIVHLIRERGVTIANIGGVVAVIGLTGHITFVGTQLVVVEMARMPDAEAMSALLESFNGSPASLITGVMGLLGFFAGMISLAVAVFRGRIAPLWVPSAIVTGLLLEFVGATIAGWLRLTGSVLFFLGLAWLGGKVLSMSDRQWERRPTDVPAETGED